MADITRLEMTTRYPFHFGRRGVGLNETDIVLGADALFSALCYMLALLEGSGPVTDLLAAFPTVTEARTPPFRLSSLMLSADGIDLLPMPRLRLRIPNMRLETRKDIKSLAWVSHAVFQQLVQGANLDDSNFIDPVSKRPYTVHDGNVWLTKAEQSKLGGEGKVFWKTQTRPRVTVDRISSRATAYSSGTVRFAEGVRLYSLIHWEKADEPLRNRIKAGFRALGDEGIGGERAYGYGQFEVTFTTYKLPLGAQQGNYCTTLSPYLPQASEDRVFGAQSRYEISLRRGWISRPGYTTLRRSTVRMLETGSILAQAADQPLVGALGDATPERLKEPGGYQVFRYGLAWPVTIADAALDTSSLVANANKGGA